MKFSQKYTVISVLEDLEEGYDYVSADWPLHITIADTFAIEGGIDALIYSLEKLTLSLTPFKSQVSHDEFFGPNKEIRVAIINKTPELVTLHYEVVRILKEMGATFNDPQYMEEGFKPHSTVQPHARLEIGESIEINNIALIDMFPNKDPYRRRIIRKISF